MKDRQFDLLNTNYDELENDKKDKLLVIGENLLNIQKLINEEKPKSTIKIENGDLKTE